jgi:hypothetical protein
MARRMIEKWIIDRLKWKYLELKDLNKNLKDPENARWAKGIQESIYTTQAEIAELSKVQKMMKRRGAFDVIVEFMGRFR